MLALFRKAAYPGAETLSRTVPVRMRFKAYGQLDQRAVAVNDGKGCLRLEGRVGGSAAGAFGHGMPLYGLSGSEQGRNPVP